MTAAESKGLNKGNRVYWRGDATDSGIITELSWDAVTITWDNGQVATVHHGDMREIQRAPASPSKAYCPIKAYYCVGILCPVGVLLLVQSGRRSLNRRATFNARWRMSLINIF